LFVSIARAAEAVRRRVRRRCIQKFSVGSVQLLARKRIKPVLVGRF
jgi:hypothetical protein